MFNKNHFQLIRRPEVLKLTGRSKSSLYQDEQAGLMPKPISIGERAVAYIKQEIEAVVGARVEGKTTEQIKTLVSDLHAQREAK
ncbi:AlpA family phage regulatory protein [Catenovulum sp. SM1970]|uniref:helix-turn-helix transcriptional regulator n=1 Tax=Marinifaba aquimaris TaxID=2741323 RepID=UPI00157196F9|nr:AlpA family phage regulatory protein [Marinifaba aquimaris]NTS75695.1 AlpA family phage regulatory protein [Marinifaba aquimaris]